MKLISLALLFLLSACGESPLFNHQMEGKNFLQNTILSESEALQFKKVNYSFIISWQSGPRMGESKFIMKTWKKNLGTMNGPYQDLSKNLHVFLWMPAMNHGSSPVKIKRVGDGEYEVSDVHFIMGGTWDIKFQLKESSGLVTDEAIVSLSI